MSKVNKIVATRSFEQAVKLLQKKHETDILKELYNTVNDLINLNITKQKSNHPLKNAEQHRDIHLAGGKLILLYKYDSIDDDEITLILELRLQDVVNHKELKSYDSTKYKSKAKLYDVNNILKEEFTRGVNMEIVRFDEVLEGMNNNADDKTIDTFLSVANKVARLLKTKVDNLAIIVDVDYVDTNELTTVSYTKAKLYSANNYVVEKVNGDFWIYFKSETAAQRYINEHSDIEEGFKSEETNDYMTARRIAKQHNGKITGPKFKNGIKTFTVNYRENLRKSMHEAVDDECCTKVNIKKVKKGDYFTMKPIAEPKESQVWIKGDYDRENKAYECQRFSDMNDFKYVKANKDVYIDFTF